MSAPVPILFVDRDGTLITEPDDFQIDAFEKLRFVDGVIPAMLRLRDAGWQFVMVTNQDGLGTDAFPQAAFDGPHALMLQVFASQGITFREVLVDTSFERDNSPNRKPNTGLVTGLLRDRGVDWTRSAMVGDRETDIRFAENLGIRGFKLRSPQFGDGTDWAAIAHALVAAPRVANVVRKTNETAIEVAVDLDDAAKPDIATGFVLPMDEAQASATLDLSGRPYFLFEGSFARERVGDLPTELVPHFFQSLCQSAGITLHLAVRGDNAHHQVEACFKVVARALRIALRREGDALPSSKGVL